MKSHESREQSAYGLPVLTEVVLMPKGEAQLDAVIDESEDEAFEPTVPSPLASMVGDIGAVAINDTDLIDEQVLVERVLADLDRQVDLMFEHRLRETLSPVLARMTDTLVREMRNQLAVSLREMVVRAVSLELDRHHKG